MGYLLFYFNFIIVIKIKIMKIQNINSMTNLSKIINFDHKILETFLTI